MQWKSFLTPVASMDAAEFRAYRSAHREGTYALVDVRQPGEYEKGHIPGARLLPLPGLADRMKELDPRVPTFVY